MIGKSLRSTARITSRPMPGMPKKRSMRNAPANSPGSCSRMLVTIGIAALRSTCTHITRAKGLSEARVMWVHVLRNAAIPIVTNILLQLPGLLAGAFLIERFFGIPGIGREVILAVERSDFPIIKAVTVYVAIATMIVNLVADLLYKAIDPRLQLK